MFKSKIRPIVIPQYEHARLAATLALMWGNAEFDRPEIDFEKFVAGVALHDWQYGQIDAISFGEIHENHWLDLMETGVDLEFSDPTVEAIAKLHMKRLVVQPESERRAQIGQAFEHRISQLVIQNRLSREKLEWADSITRFCDSLAFDFSYEKPCIDSVQVLTKTGSQEKISIRYEIKSKGVVVIDPWPFSVPSFSGFITGYELGNFPEIKRARIIPFSIHDAKIAHPERRSE